jgi:hypothetical protein
VTGVLLFYSWVLLTQGRYCGESKTSLTPRSIYNTIEYIAGVGEKGSIGEMAWRLGAETCHANLSLIVNWAVQTY